jgi:antibiotic biosynthesis monooxygenase (ABM) superfamily enzyme
VVHRFAGEGAALAWSSRAWFEDQTPTPAAPATPSKWKLWFVNMSAVFPPVLLFNVTVLPYLDSLNVLIRTLLLRLSVTALVTWILMPRLQRFFRKWLRHKRRTA